MSNFIYDDTGLNGPKSDLNTEPIGADPNQYVNAADWNQIRQALLDIQTVIQGLNLRIVSNAADTGLPADAGFIFDTNNYLGSNFTTLMRISTGGVEVANMDPVGDFTTAAGLFSWGGAVGGGGVQANNSPAYPWQTFTHSLNLVANQTVGYNDVMSSAPAGGGTANTLRLLNRKSDGANVYHAIDTSNVITTSGAKLLSVRNGGTEVFNIAPPSTGTIFQFFSDATEKLAYDNNNDALRVQGSNGVVACGEVDNSNADFGLVFGAFGMAAASTCFQLRATSSAWPFHTGAIPNGVDVLHATNGNATVWRVDAAGTPCVTQGTTSGAAVTSNTASGRASITAGSTITITNSFAHLNDGVVCTVEALGTGPTRVSTAVVTGGTITITMDAATTAGTTTVFWSLVKAAS